eukprot:EG_transcript_8292
MKRGLAVLERFLCMEATMWDLSSSREHDALGPGGVFAVLEAITSSQAFIPNVRRNVSRLTGPGRVPLYHGDRRGFPLEYFRMQKDLGPPKCLKGCSKMPAIDFMGSHID